MTALALAASTVVVALNAFAITLAVVACRRRRAPVPSSAFEGES